MSWPSKSHLGDSRIHYEFEHHKKELSLFQILWIDATSQLASGDPPLPAWGPTETEENAAQVQYFISSVECQGSNSDSESDSEKCGNNSENDDDEEGDDGILSIMDIFAAAYPPNTLDVDDAEFFE